MMKLIYMLKIHEAKYKILKNKRKIAGLKNDSKVFTEYSNDMNDIHKNIGENHANKKRKM